MATLLSEMSRAQVEDLSRRLGEPEWMREFRLAAWDVYQTLDLPRRTDEAWRRTDLTGLDLERVTAEDPAGYPAEVPDDWQALVADESQHLLVLRNGRPVFSRLPAAAVSRGLLVMDLETAIREHGDKVREHLMTHVVRPAENKFMALHAALMRGGVFVYVPKGLEVQEPISILSWADAPGPGFLGHTLVVAEPESAVTLVEQVQSPAQPGPVVQAGATELWLKQASRVRYAAVQNWGEGVWSFAVRRAWVGRDSRADWLSAEFGSELVRSENDSWCHEEGGEADFKLVFLGAGDQHFDVTATAEHPAPNTHSHIFGRGVNAGRSRSVFRGLGHIRHGARGASCYQKMKTMMLESGARADAIPSLLVEFDDVAGAGHAATTGQIDREQVFYLMARGIPEAVARRLIVGGFMSPVLERVTVPALRQSLQELIDRKMS